MLKDTLVSRNRRRNLKIDKRKHESSYRTALYYFGQMNNTRQGIRSGRDRSKLQFDHVVLFAI